MFERIKQNLFSKPVEVEIPADIKEKIDNINRNIDPSSLMDMQIELELAESENPYKSILVNAIAKRIADLRRATAINDETMAILEQNKARRDEVAEIGPVATSPKAENRYLSVQRVLGELSTKADAQDARQHERSKQDAESEMLEITLLKEFQQAQELLALLRSKYLPKIQDSIQQKKAEQLLQSIDQIMSSLYMRYKENIEPPNKPSVSYLRAIEDETLKQSAQLKKAFITIIQNTQ